MLFLGAVTASYFHRPKPPALGAEKAQTRLAQRAGGSLEATVGWVSCSGPHPPGHSPWGRGGGQGHRAGRACITFGGLAVPNHEGAQHIARGQELALCILPADALEEPPGGEGGCSV